MATTDFSGWGKKRFARWLNKNFPEPARAKKRKTFWTAEVRMYRADGANSITTRMETEPGYDACLLSLTDLLVFCNLNGGLSQPGRRLEIVLYPGKRLRSKPT